MKLSVMDREFAESKVMCKRLYNISIEAKFYKLAGLLLVCTADRANFLIKSKEIRSVSGANQKRVCQFVKPCLDGDVIEPFKHYFTLSSHQKNTRNNAKMVLLPKIRTEYGRKSFHFTGGKLFNMLRLEGRSLNRPDFSDFIDNHYK